MLSKKMVQVLLGATYRPEVLGVWAHYKDGRTVRALQARGLIKSVSWQQSVRLWRFKYTKLGAKIRRQLSFIDSTVRDEVFR